MNSDYSSLESCCFTNSYPRESTRNFQDGKKEQKTRPKYVRLWSKNDVTNWLYDVCIKYSLPYCPIDEFQMNGMGLLMLTKQDFIRRSKTCGDVIYQALNRVKLEEERESLLYKKTENIKRTYLPDNNSHTQTQAKLPNYQRSNSKSTTIHSQDFTFSNNADWYQSIVMSDRYLNAEYLDESFFNKRYVQTNNEYNMANQNNYNINNNLGEKGYIKPQSKRKEGNYNIKNNDNNDNTSCFIDDGYFSYCFTDNFNEDSIDEGFYNGDYFNDDGFYRYLHQLNNTCLGSIVIKSLTSHDNSSTNTNGSSKNGSNDKYKYSY